MAAFSSFVFSSTALGLLSSDIHLSVLMDRGRAQLRLVAAVPKAVTTTLRAERNMRVTAVSLDRLYRECMDETDLCCFELLVVSSMTREHKLPMFVLHDPCRAVAAESGKRDDEGELCRRQTSQRRYGQTKK